jgi:hypothetical protein
MKRGGREEEGRLPLLKTPCYNAKYYRREVKRMVILVYQDNVEKDYQTVMAIDWGNFDKEVKERPEDYVFILSPDEMKKFIDLNKQIKAGAEGKGMVINESDYINKYPGVFVITSLAIKPDFVKKYKIGFFTNEVLGSSYAVFYINRSTNGKERANAVLKRIKDFQANTSGDNKWN